MDFNVISDGRLKLVCHMTKHYWTHLDLLGDKILLPFDTNGADQREQYVLGDC